ncbi:hypothetical protein [Chryseobacterium aurantiacum]|uniref:hypothetical protein n=1 Tax=Chryseobacterium aurantiacum TaxID=2116499 RepID=UPI000D11D351|nr:hypothetical protein [Chryseobacterium aurantiacum]
MKKNVFSTLLLIALLSLSCKEKKTVVTKVVTTESKVPAHTYDSIQGDKEEGDDGGKSDLDYEVLDAHSFKKWKGEYFLVYKDYAGEGNAVIKVKLKLDDPESSNLWIWWEAPHEKNSDTISIFGSFGKADNTNTKIKFLPEVEAGDGRGMEEDYFLYEKDNRFYIKSGMIPSENDERKKLPIQKLK